MDSKLKRIFDRYDEYVDDCLSEEQIDVIRERAAMFAIDYNDFDEEVRRQGALYSYIGHLIVAYRAQVVKMKLQRDVEAAKIRNELKPAGAPSGRSGGLTNDQVTAMVQTNPVYLQCEVDLRNAEDKVSHFEADLGASAQKGAMLRIAGARLKAEESMKGSLTYGEETETE